MITGNEKDRLTRGDTRAINPAKPEQRLAADERASIADQIQCEMRLVAKPDLKLNNISGLFSLLLGVEAKRVY